MDVFACHPRAPFVFAHGQDTTQPFSPMNASSAFMNALPSELLKSNRCTSLAKRQTQAAHPLSRLRMVSCLLSGCVDCQLPTVN